MTQKWINYIQIGIIFILSYLLMTKGCSKQDTPTSNVIIKTEIKKIPVEKEVPRYYPKWRTRIDSFPVIDTLPVDTELILKDYYTKYVYIDTLKLDTMGNVVITDTVSLNKISSRAFSYKLEIPEITHTKEIYLNPKEWYIGGNLIGFPSQLNFIGTEILYRNGKDNMYGIGIGVNNNLQPMLSGKIYWKLKNKGNGNKTNNNR